MSTTAIEENRSLALAHAREEFRRAHQEAVVRSGLDRLLGKRTDEEARRRLGTTTVGPRRLREISLDRVLGSVGRSRDYTPRFLPRVGHDEERWAGVRRAIDEDLGVPPVEVYEVDGTYYVQDGHHRVSVLKQLGARCIEAYVTKVLPVKLVQSLVRS